MLEIDNKKVVKSREIVTNVSNFIDYALDNRSMLIELKITDSNIKCAIKVHNKHDYIEIVSPFVLALGVYSVDALPELKTKLIKGLSERKAVKKDEHLLKLIHNMVDKLLAIAEFHLTLNVCYLE